MHKPLDILIIEDVPADAAAIEMELRNAALSFATRRVETRGALSAELDRQRPDVVLSDFTLPDFDALEALRVLKAHRPDVPFILVTGNRSEEVAVECIREGADDYILKASLKRLPTSLQNAIQKKATEQARAAAEAALRRSEEQYRLIADNTRDLIGLVDLEGRFLYASPAHARALGRSPESLIGADAMENVHPDDHSAVRTAWEQALALREGRTSEFRMRHADGDWRFFESVGNWIFDECGQPQRLLLVSRDVTRRRAAEATTRALPRLIRDAQETERRRVARDLHDSVNQILSAVKFRLQSVEEKLAPREDAAWRGVLKAQAHLEKAMQEVRRISHNLRPSELDDLGLVPAVRSLVDEFADRTAVKVSLVFERLPEKLHVDVELNLYRILQEALGNIERHARAGEVAVRLSKEGAILRACIGDNGRGFDPQRPRADGERLGMGLVDMRERAEFVGGRCAVTSAPGNGTEIVIEIPLRRMEESRPKTD
jgi:two-component system sensor histidine kinase UhpB